MTTKYDGQLEIDAERGVIYFHVYGPLAAERIGSVTLLRICQLPTPIPTDTQIDVTHMYGVSYHKHTFVMLGDNDVCAYCGHTFDPTVDTPHG